VIRTACRIGRYIALGVVPGTLMYAVEPGPQAISIMLLGGMIGLGIALANVLYRTTRADAVDRMLGGVMWVILERNIPGAGKLVKVRSQQVEPAIGGKRLSRAVVESSPQWAYRAAAAGGAFGLLAGAALCRGDTSTSFEDVYYTAVFAALCAVISGLVGAALRLLVVPGLHRRNCFVGTVVGCTIGAAIELSRYRIARYPLGTSVGFVLGSSVSSVSFAVHSHPRTSRTNDLPRLGHPVPPNHVVSSGSWPGDCRGSGDTTNRRRETHLSRLEEGIQGRGGHRQASSLFSQGRRSRPSGAHFAASLLRGAVSGLASRKRPLSRQVVCS
jgi:hypothetical protein